MNTTHTTDVRADIATIAGPVPVVRTRATIAAYFDRRAAAALHLAEQATNTADHALSMDMLDIAAEALAEGRAYLAEYRLINAMRVRPV
ncbi:MULTISPECIES: hypothetical protein [Nocardia]|uniref:hypothetical protein n=1 Tax=Nocardia TaxID=1817 RepID=UPI002455B530|nr:MULTISPECIES: hypothetical protein [Nocardia]